MSKHTFKAYDSKGMLKLCTWTSASSTYAIEREVYQDRLNRFDFMWVDVTCDDPHVPHEKLIPRESPGRRGDNDV